MNNFYRKTDSYFLFVVSRVNSQFFIVMRPNGIR